MKAITKTETIYTCEVCESEFDCQKDAEICEKRCKCHHLNIAEFALCSLQWPQMTVGPQCKDCGTYFPRFDLLHLFSENHDVLLSTFKFLKETHADRLEDYRYP